MIDIRKTLHVAASLRLAAALAVSACANKPRRASHAAGQAPPGSQQDFVVNVGDRVFFESDLSELTPQARATLDNQAQWLTTTAIQPFTVEGHADERGTREYNIALGARRAQTVRDYLVSRGIRRSACAPSPTARSVRSRSATTSPAGRRIAARSRCSGPAPSALGNVGGLYGGPPGRRVTIASDIECMKSTFQERREIFWLSGFHCRS